jgi:putative membrane protein
MIAAYLYIKTFHLVLVVSWFAGLFYLPRIFVNLAMVPAESTAERARLLLMAGKLYRFMTGIMMLALALGLVLWLYFGIGLSNGMAWMHAKLTLVVLLIGYHHYCKRLLRHFEAGTDTRPHVWYRWFNEVPVLVLVVVTWLVIVKPF